MVTTWTVPEFALLIAGTVAHNMKELFTIISILTPIYLLSQIKGVIIDSKTKERVPYVNIWVENENIGTTSNENGEFELNNATNNKTIVFSSIGYLTKKVKSESIHNVVTLTPQITKLKEIVISSRKQSCEFTIGSFKKSKINDYFSGSTKPWKVARYFEYKKEYSKTPFFKSIRIPTKSYIAESRFIIGLYEINDEGEPGKYLFGKNIFGIAKKGKRITEIDISNLHIKFPEKGFFIVIEWLIIEPNKYDFTYTMKGFKRKHKGILYGPSIGIVPNETENNSWIFIQGKWIRLWKKTVPLISKKQKDKNIQLAIELTLTN